MKAAIDTNVLAYAEGIDDPDHRRIALEVLGRMAPAGAVVAVQTLGAGQAIVIDARVPALVVAAGLLLRLVGWAV